MFRIIRSIGSGLIIIGILIMYRDRVDTLGWILGITMATIFLLAGIAGLVGHQAEDAESKE